MKYKKNSLFRNTVYLEKPNLFKNIFREKKKFVSLTTL